jgi:hypothetical protein
MSILIAHRGNVSGKTEHENHPDYIHVALECGYDVEVDVWFINDRWYFGHDKPKWLVKPSFLDESRLWLHCKNIEAFSMLSRQGAKQNYFWHEDDEYTLTSRGFIWTYPGCDLPDNNGIAVLPESIEHFDWDITNAVGICSDYIGDYS